MALEPILKFFDYEHNVELTNLTTDPSNPSPVKWNVGTVKAGESSTSLFLRVWNNKGGSQLCSNMQDCKMFIYDSNGGQTEPIVTGGWLKGKCISLGSSTFKDMVAGAPGQLSIASSNPTLQTNFEISGAINNGADTAVDNFSNIEFKFTVPNGATHGTKNFSIYVSYFFV